MSFPLLLARNKEKKIEKLLVRINISLVRSLVNWLVRIALWEIFCRDELRNAINLNYNDQLSLFPNICDFAKLSFPRER